MSTTHLRVNGYQNPGWRPGRYCPFCTNRRHRTWGAVAACRFRRNLLWVQGDPPADGPCYATVSRCRRRGYRGPWVTVKLHATRAAAEQSMKLIAAIGCGGGCYRGHELVVLGGEVDFAGPGPLEGVDG
jgi:hypothetical protein